MLWRRVAAEACGGGGRGGRGRQRRTEVEAAEAVVEAAAEGGIITYQNNVRRGKALFLKRK